MQTFTKETFKPPQICVDSVLNFGGTDGGGEGEVEEEREATVAHDLSAGGDGGGARAVARWCAAPREKRHRERTLAR